VLKAARLQFEESGKEILMKVGRQLSSGFGFASVLVVCSLALSGLCAPSVLAQAPFVITSPPAGSVLAPGQAITVLWTGGDPAWFVDLYLIELTPGFPFAAVAVTASNILNTGTLANWPLPSHIDYGTYHYDTCGHTYQFYVQEHTQLSWTYGPVFTVVCGTAVAIDIKPGSFPNSINPRSGGVIPVAVLTTPTFNAASINPGSVTFGRNLASPDKSALEDVDNDGDIDLLLHFRTQGTGIACGDTAASVAGQTYAAQTVKGSDSISTVGCH
jgi:hypothetical protein